MSRFVMPLAFALAALVSPEARAQSVGDVAVLKLPDGHIRFTLFTPGGHVGFAAGADWSVLAMQSRPPVTATAFQIPDPADVGTGDSTNAIVRLIQPEADNDRAALAADDREHAGITPQTYRGWTTFTRHASQNGTPYTVMDARAPEADEICEVRLAWPNLTSHDAFYDARMAALFRTLLNSVQSGTGAYTLSPGEIVRRPTN